MKHIAVFLMLILLSFSARAYDMVVVMTNAGTGERLNDYTPMAFTENKEMICRGDKLEADGEFLLKSLPEQKLNIVFQIENDYYSEPVAESCDTFVVKIPAILLPNSLSQVTVEGIGQYITDEKSVFIPTKNQKKGSATGADLITRMGIPTLNVDPLTKSISTTNHRPVSLYIDYHEATPQEVADLRTMNVLRVETFENPRDPRFKGAEFVVNFVLVRYEYGGYAKVMGEQLIVTPKGNYSASSRLTYKKMDFQVSGGYKYSRDKHYGSDSRVDYRFPDMDVTKDVTPEDGLSENRVGYTTLRGIYQTKKMVIDNSVGITFNRTPDNFQQSLTTFNPGVYPSAGSRSTVDASSVSPVWMGRYQFNLSRKFIFMLSPSFTFGHFNNDQSYHITSDTPIYSIADEKTWNYQVNPSLWYYIGNQIISLQVDHSGTGDNLTYSGTTPRDVTTRDYSTTPTLMAYLKFGNIRGNAYAGVSFMHNETNGKTFNQTFPYFGMSFNTMLGSNSSINLNAALQGASVSLSEKIGAMQQITEIDAIEGNPNLKSANDYNINLSYQWYPANIFSLNAYSGYNFIDRPVSYTYVPAEGSAGPMMVRKFINSGCYRNLMSGLSATIRLLNNALIIRGGVTMFNTSRRGSIHYSGTNFSYDALIYYSWHNFHTCLSWNSANTQLNLYSKVWTPEGYNFSIGWGNGDWHIAAYTSNTFRSSWKANTHEIITDNYHSYSQRYGGSYHRDFNISVTYSFSYGKKIERKDIVTQLNEAESGILK